MNQQVKENIKEILFYISILPFILNWIVGLFSLEEAEKKPYVYRSFFVSLIFLFKSSLFYVLYYFITSLLNFSFFNYLFFLLQLILVIWYVGISILQILSYAKKQHFKIFDKLDFYSNKLILIIGESSWI
jgi:hypothetical protein